MTGQPFVSIIMPSLNVKNYIAECLKSVIDQTLDNIEIICVDAGSTDGTHEIIESFANMDNRVKVIDSDIKSYGYQMNIGISEATGEYIGVVETDDYVKPEMYETLYKIAKDNDLDFIKSDHLIFMGDEPERKFYYRAIHDCPYYYNRVFTPIDEMPFFFQNYNMCYTWDGIYRADFLKSHHIVHNESEGASYQDTGFRFQIYPWAKRVMFIDEPLYMLRRDNPNSSEKSTGKVYAISDEYDFIKSSYDKHPKIKERMLAGYVLKRFTSSLWNLDRVAPEKQTEFLVRFSQDFKTIEDSGELNLCLFTHAQRQAVRQLIDEPLAFYYGRRFEQSIKLLKRQLAQSRKDLTAEKKRVSQLKSCNSYRIGRAVTFLPRKVKRILKNSHSDMIKPTSNEKLIVSLTSYPARIGVVHKTIESILSQSLKASHVMLWLASEQFPAGEESLPTDLLKLKKKGLSIRWCEDMGPHKKYFYTMKENPDALIVTVDDDVIYDKRTLEALYRAHLKHPNSICARRAREIKFTFSGSIAPYSSWPLSKETDSPSLNLVATGVGGVLYPPNSMDRLLFNKDLFLQICPFGDDLWLKTMQYIAKTPTVLTDESVQLQIIDGSQETALYHVNQTNCRNDLYITKIIEALREAHPSIWRKG